MRSLFAPIRQPRSHLEAFCRDCARIGKRGLIRIWGQPLSADALNQLASPSRQDLETYPHIAYDRQTYLVGGSASISYFNTLSSDPTITNMVTAGAFPGPEWFQPFGIMVTPMVPGPSNIATDAAATNQTGIQNDWDKICKTARSVLELNIAKKQYGPWPTLACHGVGGAMGFFTQGTALQAQQQVQNGPADGGFGPQGEIVIPPTVGFNIKLIQANGTTAVTVATLIEVAVLGRLYRAPR